mgnify:CR=1 FL=1|jgi:uncharacterized protein (DUF736 family)
MSDYDDSNRGVLFKNNKKETEKYPDLSGTININGVDHWLNGWSKISQAGNKFISLSIGKPKEVKKPKEESTPTGDDGDIW